MARRGSRTHSSHHVVSTMVGTGRDLVPGPALQSGGLPGGGGTWLTCVHSYCLATQFQALHGQPLVPRDGGVALPKGGCGGVWEAGLPTIWSSASSVLKQFLWSCQCGQSSSFRPSPALGGRRVGGRASGPEVKGSRPEPQFPHPTPWVLWGCQEMPARA